MFPQIHGVLSSSSNSDAISQLSGLTAYWKLNETSGTTINDASGNGRTGTSSGVTLAQPGLNGGLAYQFAGSGLLTAGSALTAAIDPREYAVGIWIKPQTGGTSPRLDSVFTNGTLEYSSPEIRVSNRLDFYLKENGVNQNAPGVDYLTLDRWYLLIYFNSETAGQSGFYVDRLYLPVGRTVSGLSVTTIDANYPQIGFDLTGYIDRVFWIDHIPTQAEVDAIYYDLQPAESTSITNVLTDAFTGTEAAPITSPRASGLVVTDTAPLMSVSSDQLVWTGVTTSLTVPRIMSPSTYTRKQGRAVMGVLTPGNLTLGWRKTNANGSPNSQAFWFRVGQLYNYLNANTLNLVAVTTNGTVEYKTAHVMRRFGCYHIIKGGAFTEWTLIHVSDVGIDDMYAGFGVGDTSVANKVNSIEVNDLPAPFDKDFDLATSRLAGGRAAGDTFTHEANCIITFPLTKKPTGGNVDFRFREQDASNYWQLTIDSSGVMVLNEVVAGSPTPQVTTAAGAIDTSHRVEIIMDGTTIKVVTVTTPGSDVAAVKINYASATNFSSATAGRLADEGTAGSVSDIVAWPRTLSGTAVTVLDNAIA